jgi:lipoate-protein ligase A
MSPSFPPPDAARALLDRLRRQPWRVIHTPPSPGACNMATDAALLEAAVRGQAPVLRWYAWDPPALSLGRFQVEPEGAARARAAGWGVVRRPTGGRAVLHLGPACELTCAVCLPPGVVGGAGVRTSYQVLGALLNSGLRRLLGAGSLACPGTLLESGGAAARSEANCFALGAECDTLVRGRKVMGSAQVRREGALLQHGSIMLDTDPAAWQEVLGGMGRLVTLRELLGRPVSAPEVRAAVEAEFRSAGILLGAAQQGGQPVLTSEPLRSPDAARAVAVQTAGPLPGNGQ